MSYIVDVTLENAQQVLIDQSHQTLVVIDFWADWCEPCKQLMPVLEKLAHDYQGKFVLAKVNCDEQQQLAMQFGVRSLPTIAFMKDGQPVDGFAGVQPESEIKALLEKYLPSAEDDSFEQALQLAQTGDWSSALPLFEQAYLGQPENIQFKFAFINACLENGLIDRAEKLLMEIRMADQDSDYQQLLAKLDLAKQALDSPEIRALQEQLDQQPDDLDLKVKLAVALHQVHRNQEALSLLFDQLKISLSEGEIKKTFLDIIAALPSGDPLAGEYRRKLYTLLY